MIAYQKPWGFTLLEMLLVLGIISMLALVGIDRYQHYENESASIAVHSDVTLLLDALNDYFHEMGCNNDGTFSGSEAPNIETDLDLNRLAHGRAPWVSAYSAAIINSGVITQDGKPVYRLQITASFDPNVSSKKLTWYQAALNATTVDETANALIWRHLPTRHIDSQSNALWILNGTLSRFRQFKNGQDNNAASFCAE